MKSILLLSLSAVIFFCCDNTQTTKKNIAGQIISNSWEGEDDLGVDNNWKTLRPPVIITKADTGDVIILFVGEFQPKIESLVEEIEPNDVSRVYIGVPIEIRIKVNDIVASPTHSMMTISLVKPGNYDTRSFLASLKDLLPGTYTITAEWKSEASESKVRNRTLTVWESIKGS